MAQTQEAQRAPESAIKAVKPFRLDMSINIGSADEMQLAVWLSAVFITQNVSEANASLPDGYFPYY